MPTRITRDGCREIAVQRVEHPCHHRSQRHADQVGEHDRRQFHCQRKFGRAIGEARRDGVAYDERHHQFHDDRQRQKDREQHAEDFLGEPFRARHAACLDLLGKKGHEGGVECPLREKPAKCVRKLERSIERFGHRACAQRRRHHHLTCESEYAARHCTRTDRREFSHKAHGQAAFGKF
jgi:hypothetical protein